MCFASTCHHRGLFPVTYGSPASDRTLHSQHAENRSLSKCLVETDDAELAAFRKHSPKQVVRIYQSSERVF